MRLILIRHGDPDYANDCLTEKGRRQAVLLAEALAVVHVDLIFASPMGRAQLTARPAAERKKLPVTTLPWLHELDGNYDGNLWSWNQRGADAFREATPMSLENWHEQVPYGEHMIPVAAELYRHFDRFMEERGYRREGQRYRVLEGASRETVFFFCHAGLILTLLSHLLHIPLPVAYTQFGCDPTGRTTLRFEEEDACGVFRLECLNDMSHAPGGRDRVEQTGTFPF